MPPPKGADPKLARVLRQMREAQHRSQEDVAHSAGIAVNSLRRVEYGESNPAWTTVQAIIAALGISIVELGHALEQE